MGVFGDMVKKAMEEGKFQAAEPGAPRKLVDPRTVPVPKGDQFWIYIARNCDSWHLLPDYDPDTMFWERPGDLSIPLAWAQRVALQYVPNYERWRSAGRPKLYVLPAVDDTGFCLVWAVSFHKGQALLVSTVPLPWIANAEDIEWWRHCT